MLATWLENESVYLRMLPSTNLRVVRPKWQVALLV
jgi:hypothetical protein